ncbi:hypothetical protein D3C78_1022640 [compost metagenome]
MDQQLGVAHVVRLQHVDVNAAEQLRGVGGDRRLGILVDPPGEVEEVEVELDCALHLAGVHVAELPVERIDGGAISPVVAVLVVPGEFFTGARVVGVRLLRERSSGAPALDLACLATQLDLIHALTGGLDVVRVQVEGGGFANLQLGPALLDEAVEGRIDDLLELGDVAFVDGHADAQAGSLRHVALVRVEGLLDHRLVGGHNVSGGQHQGQSGQARELVVLMHVVRSSCDQKL